MAFELRDIEDQLYSIVFKESLESVEWPKLEAKWKGLRLTAEMLGRSCSMRVAATWASGTPCRSLQRETSVRRQKNKRFTI